MAEQSFQGAATVKVTMEMEEEEEEEGEEEEVVEVNVKPKRSSSVSLQNAERQYQRMQQMELEQCRLSLAEERRARLNAESKLREYELENSRLRSVNLSLSEALTARGSALALAASSTLEDEAVLESIESSFTKFHAFLDLLKDAGLGQLASIAGIDQSDLGVLGRPQVCSTAGRPLEEAESVSKGGRNHKELGAKIDAVSLEANTLTAPSEDLRFTPEPPTTPREFLSDRHMSQASGPAIDPCVDLEGRGEEPDHFSKPETQQDSGSERSFISQKSYGNSSYGNKGSNIIRSRGVVSHSGHYHSNVNSHHSYSHSHSNGSNRYSLNYSSIHDGSASPNRSHGDSSQRSSLSDIVSEKIKSVGSFTGSQGKEGARQMSTGFLGPESQGKSYPGMDTVEQMRSSGLLCGGSDDGSF